jgi:CheY-like chemotaxis protein
MGGLVSRKERNDSSVNKVNERDLNEYYESEMEDSRLTRYKRALVVDDSKFNRKMLSRTINPFFDEVVLAEDGAEAVTLVQASISNHAAFDIIFMDSIMPVMGGIEATAKIRQLGYTSLIIGVTGDITEEDAEKFVMCGVNDVMLKPLLLPHVESILIGIICITVPSNLLTMHIYRLKSPQKWGALTGIRPPKTICISRREFQIGVGANGNGGDIHTINDCGHL